MRVLAIIAAALAATAAVAAPGDNLLDNPGFESGPWPQSPGWHGTIEAVAENALSGEQAGKLVVGEEGDATIYSGYVPAVVGLRYRFTIQAKGAGTISLRSIQLTTDPDERYLIERPENHMELTDEWQEIAIEITPEDPRVLKIAVVVQLDGQGATAFLDDALLTTLGLPGGELTVTPSYAMVQPGGSASFEIAVRCDAGVRDARAGGSRGVRRADPRNSGPAGTAHVRHRVGCRVVARVLLPPARGVPHGRSDPHIRHHMAESL